MLDTTKIGTPEECNIFCNKKDTVERNEYEIESNKEKYKLIMELSDEKIIFKLKKNDSLIYYNNKYSYKKIIKLLLLQKEFYDNINKVFSFYDRAIEEGIINIIEDKSNNVMKLVLRKTIDFDEVDCILELKEDSIEKKEMQTTILLEKITILEKNK